MSSLSRITWSPGRLIFEQNPDSGLTHATNPTAIRISDNVYRIFFSTRTEKNQSVISAFDYNLLDMVVEQELPELVFDELPPGSFYQDGLGLGGAVFLSGSWYLYFMGWRNPPDGGHWQGEIGRLKLDNRLEKGSIIDPGPIVGMTESDPISVSYPCVISSENGFEMWYGTTISWDYGNGEMLHVLRQASSLDGLKWTPQEVFIPHKIGTMQAFSRPSILKTAQGALEMYFSFRGPRSGKYKIGCALSVDDGTTWTSPQIVQGLQSGGTWDNEMQEYPFAFFHDQTPIMLYNGNGYGLTGIGLSIGRYHS